MTTKQVAYRTTDRHIHELYVAEGGAWKDADLTQMTGAPAANQYSAHSAYAWDAGGTKQIAYLGIDDQIHELYVAKGGSWKHANLTQVTGAPLVGNYSPIVGYDWPTAGTKQVTYVGTDSHIHELYVAKGGSWKHADLTHISGSPSVGSFPQAA